VPAELVRRVESQLGARFSIVFGTTECSPLLTVVGPEASAQDRAGTLGTPLPQTEIKIADPATGAPVPAGQPGELCARGYLVMRGYHDAPEATAAAIDAEGWYHTGDRCLFRQGYVIFHGRLGEMIKTAGANVAPSEVEDVLWSYVEKGKPETPLILEAMARGYMHVLRIGNVLRCLDMLLERQPDNVEALMMKGRMSEGSSETHQDARKLYRRVLEIDPGREDARLHLARLLVHVRAEEARSLFESLLALRPDDPELLIGLAQTQRVLGEPEQARSLFEGGATASSASSRLRAASALASPR